MKGLSNILENLNKYSRYFNESEFWKKIESVAAKTSTRIIYYILLLFYTLKAPGVSIKKKALICGALGYLILPTDLIPDMLVPVGYTDDIAVIIYTVGLIKNEITPDIENKAREKLSRLGLYYYNEAVR
ncbi:MAG: YkvA family protein [Candidatus Azobacteroides sp.]|nr:YkvA family protein [Candidatus Azobacteroides sp.]